ncbi:MAG: hypothetical protein ABIT01_19540 [Thermoanaerobaculia bacterium]
MTRALDHKPGDAIWALGPSAAITTPYRFVKLSPTIDLIARCDTAGEFIDGVIEVGVAANDDADVITDGIVLIELGATVADLAEAATDSVGRAVTAVGGDHVAGRMIKGGAVGEIGSLRLKTRSAKSGGGSLVAFGTATLVGGTVTVSLATIKAGDTIVTARNTSGGTAGHLNAPVASIVAATSFVIGSSSGTDTSTVNYAIYR